VASAAKPVHPWVTTSRLDAHPDVQHPVIARIRANHQRAVGLFGAVRVMNLDAWRQRFAECLLSAEAMYVNP
jgi:hypothetical protein